MRYRTREIAKIFQDYYGRLYSINKKITTEEADKKREKTKAFLKDIGLNKLAEDKCSELEAPITEDEIKKILKETSVGKSPRPDGLTILYYKKFQGFLIPKLCSYMNEIGVKWDMRKESLEAIITIILKEGKDSTLCSSYRPISLLKTDTKLFAKVLAKKKTEKYNERHCTPRVQG